MSVSIDPDTLIVEPAPPPLTPKPFTVVSRLLFPASIILEPIVKLEAVNKEPLRYNLLGAEIVNDPNTLKLSPVPSFIVKVPVLLNVNA